MEYESTQPWKLKNGKKRLRSLASQGYSNCKLLSPDNVLMCRIGAKQAQWYLDRDLADAIETHPRLVIRLKFFPNGLGHHHDDFYLVERENMCVVCGSTEELTKHHCVPQCFRKHFPENMKGHASHDVLLTCADCHEEYEYEASRVKNEIVPSINPPKEWLTLKRARESGWALVKYGDLIPPEKQRLLLMRIAEYTQQMPTVENIAETVRTPMPPYVVNDPYEEYVSCITDLPVFITWWREHFVRVMKPKYLPKHWSVYGRYVHE